MTKRSTILMTASLATLLAIFTPAPLARADIFQWEYINPANPGLGKQPSTTLAPDGAGANAARGADLPNRNLTMAYLIGADLSVNTIYDEYGYPIDYIFANLAGANLSQADLTNANLLSAALTGVNLTGAEVRGANLGYSGITAAQVFSTASYLAHDLTGIGLTGIDLTGGTLAGQNLTNASLERAKLTNANFSQANLTNAILSFATLTNANLTGAEVRGADFRRDQYLQVGSGISIAQLYSTASYLAHDLTGIRLDGNELSGVNLAGKNLTNASLGCTLTNANFSGANLTNAYLPSIPGANVTGAEVRGAHFPGSSILNGITLPQLYSTASYQAHDLTAIHLVFNNHAGANLAGQNLTNADFFYATLTNANFSQANLTNASFSSANLTGANFSGAEVRGAGFGNPYGTGITMAQLYSTASYQAHDLTGIGLGYIDLTGGNLAGQNLTGADFYGATLANANLSQANLTNATFDSGNLTGANLTGAVVRGTIFGFSGITAAQLYSTASYQAHDLTGIRLWGSFVGINLAGQNLTSSYFLSANLTNANFSHANLTNADFAGYSYPIYDEYGEIIGTGVTPGADLTNANLTGADARGATFEYATLSGANTSNLIQTGGLIYGLDLSAGASLVVRDYDGDVPVVVGQHLAMNAAGTLQLVFDADHWDSTISFAAGIPVALGGTLELLFAPDVNLAGQFGRTIDLFDWTGVSPSGAFTVSSPYTWNLSKLYTSGEVTLTTALSGDVNLDGVVNIFDVNTVSAHWGTAGPQGDANGDGIVNIFDVNLISAHWTPASGGATHVPEPSSMVLCIAALGLAALGRCRTHVGNRRNLSWHGLPTVPRRRP